MALFIVSSAALVSAWPRAADAETVAVVAIGDAVAEVAAGEPPSESFVVPADAALRLSARACGGFMVGTGFVAGDGLVLTARHVVDGGIATIGGRSAVLRSVDADARDAASLTTSTAELIAAPLALEDPEVGLPVAAVGYPGGGRRVTSYGVVTGITDGALFGRPGQRLVLLSALVEEGFSGGPVFDADGVVVAMVVGVERNSGGAIALAASDLTELVDGGAAPLPCGS